LAGRLGLEPR